MIIASNFKMNHTRKSTSEFLEKLSKVETNHTLRVYPPASALCENKFVGVQNGYPAEKGSFTGEIGLTQIKEFNIDIAEVAKKFNLSIELIKKNIKIIELLSDKKVIGITFNSKNLGYERTKRTIEYLSSKLNLPVADVVKNINLKEFVDCVGGGLSNVSVSE